jgi:hypothetical protein
MTKQKKWYIAIGTILVVIVFVGVALYKNHVYFRNPMIFLPQSQQLITTDKGQQVRDADGYSLTNLKEVSGAGATTELSYDQASQLYQGSVVQLNSNCRADPITMSRPPKSVIMIGNQSQWQRTVIVGPRTYVIAPYDYILAAFNIPGTFAITCDSVQSVGIIAIQ